MSDINYKDYPHFELSEELVKVLRKKVQSDADLFFRLQVAYYFCKAASMMRTNIKTMDRGFIPINMYALNLAPSGTGKGHSTNIMEEEVLHRFKDRFLKETFPMIAEQNLLSMAMQRAAINNTDINVEEELVAKEFRSHGELLFSFDSATPAAIKQLRQKLLMAKAGSLNFEMDEVASNLLSNTDALTVFLELFDVGKTKQKLVKNTADNSRSQDVDGRTPTNVLLYGTPTKLLNGGKVEEEFMSFLEIGYGRRCFFGLTRNARKPGMKSPEELLSQLVDQNDEQTLFDMADRLFELADIDNFGKDIEVSRDVTIELLKYKDYCELRAYELPEHKEIQKAELSHRYFKALKVAGAYAFIDGSDEVTQHHLFCAIRLAEDSGKAFEKILKREKNHVKLAKYIASVGRDITQADLVEDLPFFRGAASAKQDMLQLATSWGYRNNIIIKKIYMDGIEFLRGESLQETDLDKMIFSYSDDIAYNYEPEQQPFDQLHNLIQAPGLHWANHHFIDNHRYDDKAIKGFNMIVLDVEKSVTYEMAKQLLKDYTFLIHTTKRHTEEENRFRIIIPMSHVLYMDSKDYKEFMKNVFEWLPFEVDTATGQRSRKWLTNENCVYEYNEGELLDVLTFIPATNKNEEYRKNIVKLENLSNLERWFALRMTEGNRSNELIKYALMLVDGGLEIDEVTNRVLALNDKLENKLPEVEIHSTILVTAYKHYSNRLKTSN